MARIVLFGREALVYADAVALARAAWPRWVVFYGMWTRRTYAIATFLPVAYLTSDTDPRRLGATMRAVERRRPGGLRYPARRGPGSGTDGRGPVSPERGRAAA
jgi:hypothetical protein